MRLFAIAASLFVASLAAPPALAQLRQLAVPDSAGWQHAQTGVVLRSRLAGMSRTAITDSGSAELDIMAEFGDRSDTWASVYLFRPAGGTLPIWYDRAETQILRRGEFTELAALAPARAFAPPGRSAASGLRRTFAAKGKAKSTGLAFVPLGDWLVAVRISSTTLDAPALDARLDDLVASIGWPAGAAESEAAAVVPSCATPLAYAKRAKLKKRDIGDGLIGAVLAGMHPDPDQMKTARTIRWCRDGEATPEFGTYRDAAPDHPGYMLAVGDAGIVVDLWPGLALDGKTPPWQLSLGLLDKVLIYPSFDALPRPERALDAVRKSQPVSSTARGSKDIHITID